LTTWNDAEAAGKELPASVAWSQRRICAVVPSSRMQSSVAQSIQLYFGESMGCRPAE